MIFYFIFCIPLTFDNFNQINSSSLIEILSRKGILVNVNGIKILYKSRKVRTELKEKRRKEEKKR